MGQVTKITTISMMMVFPALGGYYLDIWLGTLPVFMFLAVAIGLAGGFWQLIKLVSSQEIEDA
jgi:F0F1-type ATP synthase assembly protein I